MIEIETENDKVIRWRFESLIRAGVNTKLAEKFSENASVDIHFVIEAKEKGATDKQLAGIFL